MNVNARRTAALRWAMRVVGVVLIGLTVVAAAYARFGGDDVAEGTRLSAGEHYLVATGQIAHCTVPGGDPRRFDLSPLGARELLDGQYVQVSPGGSDINCTGGDVTATSGAALALYPMAEYDFLPVIIGAVLIVTSRWVRPSRRAR